MSHGSNPPERQTHDVIRVDLVGHSLAAEGGASQTDFGAWHKIASHLQPAVLNSAAQGGAMVTMTEGTKFYTGATYSAYYSGQNRVFHEWPNTQRGTLGPYLPASQFVCVWYGANDLGRIGPTTAAMTALKDALRTVLARLRAATVFEDTNIAASFGVTPCTFTAGYSTVVTNNNAIGSGGSMKGTTVAYPTNKVTLQVPPDYGAGTICIQVATANNGDGALYDLIDVTAGGATTLFTGWETRNLGATNHSQGSTTRSNMILCKRLAIGAAPTTTLTADLKADGVNGTTITVTSTAAFDTAGALQLDSERITYTGKTATTFTGCTRAVGGTYTDFHASGTSITGTRTFELRPTALTGIAYFDCWQLEAADTPLTYVMLANRIPNYTLWNTWPYAQTKTKLASNTAINASSLTVASTTLTAAVVTAPAADTQETWTVADGTIVWPRQGNVKIDSEVVLVLAQTATSITVLRGQQGTTPATHTNGTAVYPWIRVGDTITVGTDTRSVASITGAAVTLAAANGGGVTVNMASAHTAGDVVTSGIQDFDFRSVMNPAVQALVTEFADPNIFTVDPEVGLFGSPDGTIDKACFAYDAIHFSDEGHARLAAYFLRIATPKMTSFAKLSRASQPDRLAYTDSAYNMFTFQNSWSSYATLPAVMNTAGAPFGYRKDFITRRVRLRGAVKNTSIANSATVITTLPLGYRPITDEDWYIGPHRLRIAANGDLSFPDGLPQVSYVPMNVTFEAGG